MGKIVDEYEKIKAKDKETLLLFKMGKFYIFIGDDADYINKYMVLKKTKFSNKYEKCGFPCDKIDAYKNVFNNLNLKVKIIDYLEEDYIKNLLLKTDYEKLSKKEAIDILLKIKAYYE